MASYAQNLNCNKWMLGNIPAFDGGSLSEIFLNCGSGLADDVTGHFYDESFMHTVEQVSEAEFRKYTEKLVGDGFILLNERNAENNIFCELKKGEIRLHTEYFGEEKTARIIEVGAGVLACEFGTEGGADIRSDTVLVQYSLHYGKMIRGVTADCGMMYVLRLRDNSVILIDGGEIEQATEVAIADFMKLLHELTNTQQGEKIRIALWYCTHAHDDHMDFFIKLIRRYSEQLNLERVSFNFPSNGNIEIGKPATRLRENINAIYPHVSFLKLFTGQSFAVNSAKITVLMTHENICTGNPEKLYNGMNKTSSIIRIEFENESLLLLADAEEVNGEFLIRNYSASSLASTFIQAAHHGINYDENIYAYIKAPYLLLPQARRESDAAPNGVFGVYLRDRSMENILVAGEQTDIFTCNASNIAFTQRAHVGTAYDNSGF